MSEPERLILIVDTGIDDALALALAVRHPRCQLEAVITSWGNVGLEQVSGNTLRVLDWLGATDVSVFGGSAGPLVGDALDAAYWHGADGLGGARLPSSARAVQSGGIDWFTAHVAADPGAITVVCTAPLTVLAQAVERDARFVSHVKQVIVMGGAARPPGNTTPVAEFNIYVDPEAAAIVFQQSWPLVMVGLDVTNQVQLSRRETVAIASLESPAARLIAEVTRFSFLERGVDAISLHDPLAVAVALDPTLVTIVPGPVLVETRGQHTRGQTIVDWRRGRRVTPSNTRVCVDVDVAAARSLFFETLGIPAACHPDGALATEGTVSSTVAGQTGEVAHPSVVPPSG